MNSLLLHPGGDLHDQWGLDWRRSVHRGRLGASTVFSSVAGSSRR
jgi:hypothetical protein